MGFNRLHRIARRIKARWTPTQRAIQAAWLDSALYGRGTVRVQPDGTVEHVPFDPFAEPQPDDVITQRWWHSDAES